MRTCSRAREPLSLHGYVDAGSPESFRISNESDFRGVRLSDAILVLKMDRMAFFYRGTETRACMARGRFLLRMRCINITADQILRRAIQKHDMTMADKVEIPEMELSGSDRGVRERVTSFA